MTKHQLIDILSSYQANKRRIENLSEEIARLQDMASSLGGIGNGMPSSHNVDNARYTKAIDSLADTEQELCLEISTLSESLRTTEQYIELEPRYNRKIILQMKYIDGQTITDISCAIDRNIDTVYKIHNAGIEDILTRINKTGE